MERPEQLTYPVTTPSAYRQRGYDMHIIFMRIAETDSLKPQLVTYSRN